MKHGPDIARVAVLIADPARANMLTALMSGKALTGRELAGEAGVTAPTASSHLSRLVEGGLIAETRQGRHKYFTLAGAEVASVLENLMSLAADKGHLRTRTGPKDAALREARVCYNHLAGARGVQVYDSLVSRGFVIAEGDDLRVANAGHVFFTELGVDLEDLAKGRSPVCKPCLDWSARRPHLAGSLGRALFKRFEMMGWIARDRESRVVRVSALGKDAFRQRFPVAS